MVITRCNNCGIESRNQREGDGCHTCMRGWMVEKRILFGGLSVREYIDELFPEFTQNPR